MRPSRFCCLGHMWRFALRIVFVWSLHRSWECFKHQSIVIQLRLLLFYTCKVNVEIAVRELFNELSISGSNFLREQTLVNTSKAKFVDFGLNFGDLFRTLLCWKRKLLNNLNCNLVSLGGIIIFPPTKRQAARGWKKNTTNGQDRSLSVSPAGQTGITFGASAVFLQSLTSEWGKTCLSTCVKYEKIF